MLLYELKADAKGRGIMTLASGKLSRSSYLIFAIAILLVMDIRYIHHRRRNVVSSLSVFSPTIALAWEEQSGTLNLLAIAKELPSALTQDQLVET